MTRHNFTSEERARGASEGGKARAARYRELRDEAQRDAIAQLAGMTAKALLTLEAILDAEDDPDAFRAAKDVLDRVLGRPTQAVEVTGGEGEPSAVENRRGVNLADVIRFAREAGLPFEELPD